MLNENMVMVMIKHHPTLLFTTFFIVFLCVSLEADCGSLKLVDQGIASKHNAKCLDGSLPGFYISEGLDTHWVLYFRGGGWCSDENNCLERSKTSYGSSTHLPSTYEFKDGYTADDPEVNPVFSNFTRVILWYCDGASFAGMKRSPIEVNGTLLYFRGRANLDAMVEDLIINYNLSRATDVLLSGGSAGGLATFLHADYVPSILPKTVKKYKVSPSSGFFLNHTNFDNEAIYPNMIRYIYKMQNVSGSVSTTCRDDRMGEQHFECMFAQVAYKYIQSPIFLLQSQLDAWQLTNIYPQSEQVSWKNCLSEEFLNCTTTQIDDLNAYGQYLLALARESPAFQKKGNGGFFHSCFDHDSQQSSGWTHYTVNVTMKDAANSWWNSGLDDASKHTYMQQHLLQYSQPHQTNPSC
eukprot:m.63481 g.63481  ORF g.63481 m.63481 type:complete len:409 (-) comp8071_c1_seq1:1731-2957(-)